MRSTVNLTLHAILAAALVAFAATSAAAADAYLKLGDIKGEVAAGGGQIEIQSFHWGPRQSTSADGSKMQPGGGAAQAGAAVAAGDLDGDGRADVVASEGVGGSPAASGLPTGKRQHKPMTITKPMESGSMTFRGLVTTCSPGTTHRTATMVTRSYTYEFRDVVISNCPVSGGGGGGGSLPMEEISFNYAKVVTKATTAADRSMWDLKKNEKP